jgi:hypothetical protein
VLGGAISGWHKALGAGVAGAGLALGGKVAAEKYLTTAKETTKGLGRIPDYAYRKYGATPQIPYYRNMPQMGAVQANIGAIEADLGAIQAELSKVQANLY